MTQIGQRREPASEPRAAAAEVPLRGHQPVGFLALTLGSVGVVYGDIGTSPLYALREALRYAAVDGLSRGEVLGVVSLLLWALILIVSLKYVLLLLRLENRGEGGVLSLFALAQSAIGRRTTVVFVLGIAGAALFFGDAIITPAISVLSAVEGLELVTPLFSGYVVPIGIVILVLLFAVQYGGTGAVAAWFGPVTVLWFLAMAAAGGVHVWQDPAILAAFNPVYAVAFLGEHGLIGLIVLGAIFLAVTGAEALYADLGHFGRRPIQLAWFGLVFPALALNYLGQGALVLADPAALRNPFFLLVPGWALLPLVILATAATVIASQAVITGAFSIARQAIQLGLLPRLEIRHTSAAQTGQIYLPFLNWLLLSGVLVLVLFFETSSALASAYGVAVSGTMVLTTVLASIVLRQGWKWPLGLVLAVCTPIAAVEGVFLFANLIKLPDGGYVAVVIAACLMVVMWTWSRGTSYLFWKTRKAQVPFDEFIRSMRSTSAHSVPGTAVFLTSDPRSTPVALLHNLKHNHVLHQQIVILTVTTTDEPRLADADRVSVERLDERFVRVELRFGFMETPNVGRSLRLCRKFGLIFDLMTTSFFLGRRKLVADRHRGMPLWQDRIYIALSRVAADPSDFYHLPKNRVVELGSQIAV